MPRLISFAVCEKCLIGGDGSASLIVLMQEVTVEILPDSPQKQLPANAVGPQAWCIYALWAPFPDERGVEFTEVVEILWPDKTQFKKQPLSFRFKEHGNLNLLLNVLGLPVGQVGTVKVNMWLERDSKRIGDIYSWDLEVKHKQSK